MQATDPLLIALIVTAALLALVLGVAWHRGRRHAERVERLESAAKARLQEVESEHSQRVDRLTREWEGVRERAHLGLARDLLPAIDAVESALESTDSDTEIARGVEMIRREMLDAFAAHGIERISPAPGEHFDPELHEAVEVADVTDETPAGTIAVCRRSGYRHDSSVLRPAMVSVARD